MWRNKMYQRVLVRKGIIDCGGDEIVLREDKDFTITEDENFINVTYKCKKTYNEYFYDYY